MTLKLTEQQRRERVADLGSRLEATVRTITQVDQLIAGLPKRYSRGLYGSKARHYREAAYEEYKKQRAELVVKQEELVQQINEHQKHMAKPLIHFNRPYNENRLI